MTDVVAQTTQDLAHPEVRTATGSVRGRWEGGLAIFRGIPFAQAPVGEARFAAPRPARAWDGVREAAEFGPPPPQEALMGLVVGPELSTGDEWLTVNVWTPEPDSDAHRPVMVWIYGGAYKLGHSGSPGYDAQHIAREGDVVVVTVNYRVGIEGFAQISGAVANRGLLDQVAGLRWVRENIAAFGGDPDQVTIFGESAGGGSVAALLAMPSAAGLFTRAIAQSVPSTFFSDALAADIATAIAAQIGRRPTVADLSEIDPRTLPDAGAALTAVMAKYENRWGFVAHTLTPFSPVVDGEVLSQTPWDALAGGAGREVGLMAGHNRDEHRLFLALGGKLGTLTEADAAQALRLFGPGSDPESAYRAAFPEADAEKLCETVQTDFLFRMPTLRLAQAQVAGGGRAHMYELTWPAPGMGGALGACHGLDIPLLFGTYGADLGAMLLGPEPGPEADILSVQFRRAWTAFARTGDPGWSAFDAERRLTRIFDVSPETVPYPEEASRRVWAEHTFPVLPLLRG